ncbi:hypothetical protein Z945_2213 [Sulfitobacter noctilucae]|nr:hypothetical protein Z945_2213 [Sulfitobacter noctilucae]
MFSHAKNASRHSSCKNALLQVLPVMNVSKAQAAESWCTPLTGGATQNARLAA